MNRLGTKQYELTDHLGNVVVTVLDRRTGIGNVGGLYTGWRADVHSVSDYYPFGMPMAERSVLNGGYRFGYIGMEQDNELKGIGNSYDFGARMYDSRVGLFLSLDPLSKQFPSESNYSYAGNSPIYLIDKDGERKTIYHYVIDLRAGTIKIPKHGIIVDGLISKHQREYYSIREYWSWYDYSVNHITIIDMNGKKHEYESAPFDIDYTKERSWTILPLETAGRIAAGESPADWMKETKDNSKAYDGDTYTGFRFVSKGNAPWIGRDNHLNPQGDANSETVYVDDILNGLGIVGNSIGNKQPLKPLELLKYLNDAINTADRAQSNRTKSKDETYCGTCKTNVSNSDTSKHILRPKAK